MVLMFFSELSVPCVRSLGTCALQVGPRARAKRFLTAPCYKILVGRLATLSYHPKRGSLASSRRHLTSVLNTGDSLARSHEHALARSPVELMELLTKFCCDPVSDTSYDKFEAMGINLQSALVDAPMDERLLLLKHVSDIGALPGRPYPVSTYFFGFLESYTQDIDTLRDGETLMERAMELRHVLLCFHRAGVNTERLRLLYGHVEHDFPRFEAIQALLPMPAAVKLCHTMLSTGLSSAPAVVTLLRAALREPLMHFADDSQELRDLKMVEFLLRVDFLHTLEKLPPEVAEYLSVVRSLRYYAQDLRRDTALSYQLAYFLRKHNFPAKRHMLGPYALKVCDPEERIAFEPVDERVYLAGMPEQPPARKRRHLEAVGWRCFQVKAEDWQNLGHYDSKSAYVREMLRRNSLINP